jgi:hypothetical protein
MRQVDLPVLWSHANKSRKLCLNFPTTDILVLLKLAPHVELANLAAFVDAMPTQSLVELIRGWSGTLKVVHLPAIGLSSISSVIECLQRCKSLQTVYAANHSQIQKFAAAAGASKWLQTLSLLPLPV